MADEWAEHGIRVNSVAPDSIATPRVIETTDRLGIERGAVAAKAGVPLARYGTPAEIAGPLVFLLSHLSSFMTGQCLIVDGGMRAQFPHRAATTWTPALTADPPSGQDQRT